MILRKICLTGEYVEYLINVEPVDTRMYYHFFLGRARLMNQRLQRISMITLAAVVAFGGGSGSAQAALVIAGELLVDLDAQALSAGPVSTWTNAGTLVGDFTGFGDPTVEIVGKVNAVNFDGDDRFSSAPDFLAPAGITGGDDWSLEVWAYNTDPPFDGEETMVAWAPRATGGAATAQFTYGTLGGSGAVVHWGGDQGFEFPGLIAPRYTAGDGPFSVAPADIDGDGHVDLVTANNSSDNISVLQNRGDGTFEAQVTYAVGDEPYSVAAANLDSDGHVDLVTANNSSDNISVLRNRGDGTFEAQVTYAAGEGTRSVAAVDVDGDGRRDIRLYALQVVVEFTGNILHQRDPENA